LLIFTTLILGGVYLFFGVKLLCVMKKNVSYTRKKNSPRVQKQNKLLRLTIFLGIASIAYFTIVIVLVVNALTMVFYGDFNDAWIARFMEPILLSTPLVLFGRGLNENN